VTDAPAIDRTVREAIHEAVKAVASRCDGAHEEDGVGFSGVHAHFGNMVAGLPTAALSDEVIATAHDMLRTYRGQLSDLGIDYDALPRPPVAPGRASKHEIRAIVVDRAAGVATISFGYDEAVGQAVRRLPGRRWDPVRKVWTCDADPGALRPFAREWGFSIAVAGEDGEWTDTGQTAKRAAAKGRVTVDGDRVVLAFAGYRPELVDAVRSIPGRQFNRDAKTWSVPAESTRAVLRMAEAHGLDVDPAVVATGPERTTVRVAVQPGSILVESPYLKELRDALAGLGGKWSQKLRRWQLPMEAADALVLALGRLGLDHDLDVEAVAAMRAQVEENLEASRALAAELPPIPGLAVDLYPFQKAGVAFLAKNPRALVADHVGLGKSLSALATIELREAYPAIIVCPASIKLNWAREARRALPGREVAVLNGTTPRPFGLMRPDVVILNYDIVGYWARHLLELAPKAVVADESHVIKSPKALRTQHLVGLSHEAGPGVRLALSATPVLNDRKELASQLDFLGRLDEFGGAYAVGNTYDVNDRLRAAGAYLRRTKAQVLPELPPVRWSHVPLDGDPKVMKEYRRAEAELLEYLAERAAAVAIELGEDPRAAAVLAKVKAASAEHLVRISTLKRIAARAKIKAMKGWVADFLDGDPDEKLLLFAHHLEVVDSVQVTFGCPSIQGGQSVEERMAVVDRFQDDPDTRLAALGLTAGGVGLTLTAAKAVVFVEQGWTPGIMDQAVGRCIVAGQKVQTRRGAVPIECVVEGDEVLTHRGRWRQVEGVASRLAEEWLEIRAVRHLEPLRCTPDHLLWTKDIVTGNVAWRRADNLDESCLLALPRQKGQHLAVVEVPEDIRLDVAPGCIGCGRDVEIVTHGLCNACRLRWRKKGRPYPEDYVGPGEKGANRIAVESVILTPSLLRALGRWLGDGWLARTGSTGAYRKIGLCGHLKEREAVEMTLQTLAEAFGLDVPMTSRVRGNALHMTMSSVEMARCFERWFFHSVPAHRPKDSTGGRGVQGVVKRLAPWMLGLAPDQAWAVLQGLLDSDGHWRPDGSASFVSTSPHLAHQVALLAAQVGFAPGVSVLHAERRATSKIPAQRRAYDVRWQRAEHTRIRHDLRHGDGDAVWCPVTSVGRRLDPVTVHDLTVSDDHSFVVGQAAVHNCYGRLNEIHGADAKVLVIEDTIDVWIADLLQAKRLEVDHATDGIDPDDNPAGGTSILGELVEQLTVRALGGPSL